jgi:bifunctional ADP-heptose synthase (sugar kinase/adenylyltransferase)
MPFAEPRAFAPVVKELVRRLKDRKVRIAVVGDVILDNTIAGEPSGNHPEFKIPLLTNAARQESIGGAANIALALARLGTSVTLFSVIGSDLAGRQMQNLLDRQAFDHYLITEKGWPTPSKDWIFSRENGQERLIQRIDYDRSLPERARHELVGEFRVRCPNPVDVVILADHNLGSIGPESLPLVGLAKEQQAKVLGIPRSQQLRNHPLDAIILNGTEMKRLMHASDHADAMALAQRYARDQKTHVFLTRFEEGLYICPGATEPREPITLPALPLDNPDWMGVRDVTTVIVALGLACKMDLALIGRVCTVFRHLAAAERGNARVIWRDVFRFVGLEDEAAALV